MGNTAEELDVDQEQITDENLEPNSEEEVKSEEGDAPQEKQLSQDEVNAIVAKNKARLRQQKKESDDEAEELRQKLEAEQQRNKLLELAAQQKQSGPPNADDYDEGEYDPKFKEAQDKYNADQVKKQVEEQLEAARKREAEQQAAKQQTQKLEQRQEEHYKQVVTAGLDGYIEAEDRIIEKFGKRMTNDMIKEFDDAHLLFYYLDKNPAEADAINNLLSDPNSLVRGVAKIGGLIEKIKDKPKLSETPNPDEPLDGGLKADKELGPKGATFE